MTSKPRGLLIGTFSLLICACSGYADPGRSASEQAVGEVPAALSTPIVVYTNLGAGMTFDAAQAWTINGSIGPGIGRQAISQQFTPQEDARFGSAKVALAGPGVVDLYLQKDSNGLPGAVIEKIQLSGLTSTPALFTATSTLKSCLAKDEPYWLSVVAGAPGVIAGWHWNSTGDVSDVTFASTQDGTPSGPWYLPPTPETRSAFQINAAPTPQAVISLMIAKIRRMVEVGALTHGRARALIAKLRAVLRRLEAHRMRPARNQMAAFRHQVRAFVRSGKLDPKAGEELQKLGNRVFLLMGC